MNQIFPTAVGILALLLSGCGGPYSTEPLSNGSARIGYLDRLAGEWEYSGPRKLSEERPDIKITLLDKENAHFNLRVYSSKNPDWKGQSIDFLLRNGINNTLFASFFDPDQNESERRYSWIMLKLTEDSCIAWLPHSRAYEEAIKNDALLGKVIEGDPNQITIEDTNENLIKVISMSQTRGYFWDWESPRMFIKEKS